jgi:hypothetical protein
MPGMMMPLATSINHTIMHPSLPPLSDSVVTAIMELTTEYRLVGFWRDFAPEPNTLASDIREVYAQRVATSAQPPVTTQHR